MCGVADYPHVAQWPAGSGVHQFVEAPVGAGQYAGIHPRAEFAEAFRLALEQDGAGRSARPPKHGLRAFDHGQLVVGFRRNVGGRRVHPPRTGAKHHAAVGEDVQARAEHAAQHRVAIGAAVAYRREAGNRLEVIRAVAGRQRLARKLRVRRECQRRAGRHAHDHYRVQRGDAIGGGLRPGGERGGHCGCQAGHA
ncbi:hypothetical protein D3C87_1351710 [compost metagenome]